MFDFGGAIGSFLGPILGNEQARKNNAEQHDWAVEDAATSRGWQQMMSNTAHQREVEDLKKAGFKPGAFGNRWRRSKYPRWCHSYVKCRRLKDFGNVVASALEAKLMKQELLNKKALEQQTNSATAVNAETANKTREEIKKIKKETDVLSAPAAIFRRIGDAIQTVPDKIREHGEIRGEFFRNQERLNKLEESSRAVPRKFKQPDKPAFIPPKKNRSKNVVSSKRNS